MLNEERLDQIIDEEIVKLINESEVDELAIIGKLLKKGIQNGATKRAFKKVAGTGTKALGKKDAYKTASEILGKEPKLPFIGRKAAKNEIREKFLTKAKTLEKEFSEGIKNVNEKLPSNFGKLPENATTKDIEKMLTNVKNEINNTNTKLSKTQIDDLKSVRNKLNALKGKPEELTKVRETAKYFEEEAHRAGIRNHVGMVAKAGVIGGTGYALVKKGNDLTGFGNSSNNEPGIDASPEGSGEGEYDGSSSTYIKPYSDAYTEYVKNLPHQKMRKDKLGTKSVWSANDDEWYRYWGGKD